jgi:hypothetical protein
MLENGGYDLNIFGDWGYGFEDLKYGINDDEYG